MSRDRMQGALAFISDTHAGGTPDGFQQQPRRLDLADAAFAGLAHCLREHKVDFVIHAGDHTEHGTEPEIRQALARLGSLGVSVGYVLGNHDLMGEDSWSLWNGLPHPRGVHRANAMVPLDGLDVILLNNAWYTDGREGMRWIPQAGLQERMASETLAWLDRTLAAAPDRPAAVAFHTPLDPIPPRLTGRAEPIHAAFDPYIDSVSAVLNRHPRVRLVLSGHNHATVATRHGERLHLTVSALIEVPFEFRIIRWSGRALSAETLASMPIPPDAAYDRGRAWVNGAAGDRRLQDRFNPEALA